MISDLLAHLPVYLAILLPLLGAALIVGLRVARPSFQGLWFLALLFAFLTFVMVLLSRPAGQHIVPLLAWGPASILPFSPVLQVDSISWPFAVCLSALLFAILMTAVVRLNPGSWRAWAGSLGLTGLGLVAVWAGNPLTILLSWSALDLLELLVQLFQVRQSSLREGGVLAFAARIAGTAAFLLALVVSRSLGKDLAFDAIPLQVGSILLLSAGLRLGVLPIQAPLLEEIPMRRGVGTALRLAPAAASLVLLARTASIQFSPLLVSVVLVFASLAAFYSSIAWLASGTELSGRPFWMLGFASLAVASAVRGSVEAVLAWGLALMFSGALLFLYSARHPYLSALALFGLVGASSLPFTPTWAGAGMFSNLPAGQNLSWQVVPNLLLFMSLIMLLLGYLKHVFSPADSMQGREPWAWFVYPTGLTFLLVVHFGLGWLYRPDLAQINLISWLAGAGAAISALFAWWVYTRGYIRLPGVQATISWGASFWGQALSLAWLYRTLWWVYQLTSRFLQAVSRLQEGDGGLIWAFLLLLLVLSLAINGLAPR